MKASLLMSFLDLITCTLGGVLVILFTVFGTSSEEISELQKQREALAGQSASDQERAHQFEQAHKESEKAKEDLDRQITSKDELIEGLLAQLHEYENEAERAAADTGKTQTVPKEVVGLKGSFRHVVFVFDTSGSMASNDFEAHKSLLTEWIRYLEFDEFVIMSFSSSTSLWRDSWTKATEESRNEAIQHISTWQPAGATVTAHALSEAFQLQDVDTIVVFSDGSPTDMEADEILAGVRKANSSDVVINVIAIGDYFRAGFGSFLKLLAAQNGGVFLGR